MLRGYQNVAIIYGGTGKSYAAALHQRITQVSRQQRYPLSASIVLERILTRELLADVMVLFRDSAFCVAFLTADDRCLTEDGCRLRLRQNVVLELGMALTQLGRERCILLSDFDPRSPEFDLPSDLNSMEITRFDPTEPEEMLTAVMEKLLQLSGSEATPYDHLLRRKDYYIDYENLFAVPVHGAAYEGPGFLRDILRHWTEECRSFSYFDERCIYLLERLGFLPIFGNIPEADQFLLDAAALSENYNREDIQYHHGTDLLDFCRSLILCVVEYTACKSRSQSASAYEKLLADFEPFPAEEIINPLLPLVYYDYRGLVCLRLHRITGEPQWLRQAEEDFQIAMTYVDRVDMSMQIWSGFLCYNLARVYARQERLSESSQAYEKAIRIRKRWLKSSHYNLTVRNALSYEYFLARIDYVDMRSKYQLLSDEETQRAFEQIEAELNAYSDTGDRMDQLLHIRRLLDSRKSITATH